MSMRLREALLVLAVASVTALLIVVSAVADLRAPQATAELGASLAADPSVREVVSDALIEALLADAAQRSPVASSLLALIRPLLTQAASTAIDSPAGQAALASALTDALRQLTFPGPIVIDLRAAALIAADTAPPPLDTLARTAVEQGDVGLLVIGDDAVDPAYGSLVGPDGPPSDDALSRIAGLPARTALVATGLALVGLLIALIGRDPAARPRRLMLAGPPLLLLGGAAVLLIRSAPEMVAQRLAPALPDPSGPFAEVLPLLLEGLAGLLGATSRLAAALMLGGAVLLLAGMAMAANRRLRAAPQRSLP